MIRTASRDHVTTITLDRPEKLNAFAGTMREDLLATLAAADTDRDCRVVVITGAGRAFSAGGDVAVMAELQRAGDEESFRRLLEAGAAVIEQVLKMSKPVVAAINGVAAGAGCNLALACDYRIASSDAKLGETFVRIGLHPDWGGTWLLPRIVSRGTALELLATGRLVDAEEALRLGLIDRLVPAASFSAAWQELAHSIAAGPPAAITDIKRALAASETNDLRAQLVLETEHQLRAFRSRDSAEGMAAFVAKRTPEFRGE